MAAATTDRQLDTLRLRMKIDAHEFEAEGPRDVVVAQLDTRKHFTGLANRIPAHSGHDAARTATVLAGNSCGRLPGGLRNRRAHALTPRLRHAHGR